MPDAPRNTIARNVHIDAIMSQSFFPGSRARVRVALFAGALLSLQACARGGDQASEHADITRGREAARSYGCDACHSIGDARSRIAGAAALDGIANQAYIAGILPNTEANLARWIRNPRALKPQTAMPTLAVSEAEARDIARYLLSLRNDQE